MSSHVQNRLSTDTCETHRYERMGTWFKLPEVDYSCIMHHARQVRHERTIPCHTPHVDKLAHIPLHIPLSAPLLAPFRVEHKYGTLDEVSLLNYGVEVLAEGNRTVICMDDLMATFLDGLIIDRRGPPQSGSKPPPEPDRLTNNAILKKIRIALKLQEADMIEILAAGGQRMSKGEITALFRKPGHKHFRACGDQVVRAFLRGLTARLRPND